VWGGESDESVLANSQCVVPIVFPLLLWLGRGTLCHLQRFLKYIHYFIFEFTPCIAHLYLPPPPQITGLVSTGIIFALTCMCTHVLHHVHPSTHFQGHPPPTDINPAPWEGPFPPSYFPILQKTKKLKGKHDIFAWLKLREFFCDIFMCICVISPIVLSPVIIYIIP
jgi:hypothetical protein